MLDFGNLTLNHPRNEFTKSKPENHQEATAPSQQDPYASVQRMMEAMDMLFCDFMEAGARQNSELYVGNGMIAFFERTSQSLYKASGGQVEVVEAN
jgi:hypothetical protein